MDRLKIEIVIIIFSILLVFGLGVRANIETDIRIQENRILELEGQIDIKANQIEYLQERLQPLSYSQPLNKIMVSSATGFRLSPMGGGTESLHRGVDLIGRKGDPIYAVLAGTVIENWIAPGWRNGIFYRGHKVFGGYIVIDHGDQLFSLYGHLSKTLVHEGDWVEAGQQIGEMGNTGISTGCHLHLEIVINPFKYLKERR